MFPSFNPVCRELGAPPKKPVRERKGKTFQSRLPGVGGSAISALFRPFLDFPLSIPFAGSWGLRQGFSHSAGARSLAAFNPVCRELGAPPSAHRQARVRAHLSIPFAGSWGLRHTCEEALCLAYDFQSRLPGVGGSASSKDPGSWDDHSFQSRLPGVGGSALTGGRLSWTTPSSDGPRLSIPFAGSWGLRPDLRDKAEEDYCFQSRLPGVGGSALATTCRGSVRRALSIPFAGSWGLRLRCKYAAKRHLELSIPFAGSWGLRHNQTCIERYWGFQSRLPGVGGSAPC